jgi:outer membrane lipoprotein SlyB
MADDNIQHGLDDNPRNDAEKGAALGGLGGAAVGAVAGSAGGPVGTVVGAVAGGLAGAGASGAAVGAVDKVDNDNTVTGLGDKNEATRDVNDTLEDRTSTSR